MTINASAGSSVDHAVSTIKDQESQHTQVYLYANKPRKPTEELSFFFFFRLGVETTWSSSACPHHQPFNRYGKQECTKVSYHAQANEQPDR